MTTPNTGIPYVPEGTLDPAAGLNLALDVIDALLQTAVLAFQDAPPVGPSDGDLYIVGTGSGVWAGHDDELARYVAEGTFWQFYLPGDQVHLVLNLSDGGLYAFDGSNGWLPAVAGSGSGTPAVVNTAAANLDADASNAGNYTRFSHASPTYTFDDGETYAVNAEYHGRYVGTGTLMITEAGGMTVNPPAGGTLEIPPGGTFTVKIVASDEADLFGVTEQSS